MSPGAVEGFAATFAVSVARKIVPEFIQNSATPENLASAAFQIFSDAPARNRQREELAAVVELLGPGGAVERAADVVIGVATT